MLAAIETMNSEPLTVPMIVRGLRRPLAISVEVVTGPHPPPPDASRNPPAMPSGVSSQGRRRADWESGRGG